MLQPNVGQLLQALGENLRETVLPAVAEPAAQRQLKAALHLLGRLSRCWDLPHVLVQADNADLDAVIAAVEARIISGNEGTIADRLLCPDDMLPVSGINAPQLAEDVARNLVLRKTVERLELRVRTDVPSDVRALCIDDLHGLFARMTARESILVGDVEPPTLDMNLVSMKV